MLDKTSELHVKIFMPGGGQTGWTRGFKLQQLGVNYHGSPIIVDETLVKSEEAVDLYCSGNNGTVWGSDRAPNDPKCETSLFNIFGSSYHTVLLFSEDNTTVLDALENYPAGIIKSIVILPQKLMGIILADYILVDGDGYMYKH